MKHDWQRTRPHVSPHFFGCCLLTDAVGCINDDKIKVNNNNKMERLRVIFVVVLFVFANPLLVLLMLLWFRCLSRTISVVFCFPFSASAVCCATGKRAMSRTTYGTVYVQMHPGTYGTVRREFLATSRCCYATGPFQRRFRSSHDHTTC